MQLRCRTCTPWLLTAYCPQHHTQERYYQRAGDKDDKEDYYGRNSYKPSEDEYDSDKYKKYEDTHEGEEDKLYYRGDINEEDYPRDSYKRDEVRRELTEQRHLPA